ncbi:GTP-binding protein [Platanthera zijinensis]|uniref:GTP-binding protein n=1 Tax=Platanthera zijinensis TaxID=2320716 RepID=A0AAP0BD84_9ASPA
MTVGVRMTRSSVHKPADRRNKSIVGGKGHTGGYKIEDSDGRHAGGHKIEDSDDKVFYRAEKLDSFSNLGKKGRNLRSDPMKGNTRFERGKENDSDLSHWRMRTADPSKNAGRERRYLVKGRKEWDKNVNVDKKSRSSNVRLFTGKPYTGMRRVVDGDASNYVQSNGGFSRGKERSMKTEASAGKIRFKRRRVDGGLDKKGNGDDAEEEELEKQGVDGKNQISEQKPVSHPTRVLDKTGKMMRVQYKSVKDGSTETIASKKKNRRVIKIDPYDFSNKRLDDGVPKSDVAVGEEIAVNKDIAAQKETMLSMNAQFRAIQPSDEILSFVEDNLLGRRRLIELRNAGYNVKLSAPLDNIPFSMSTDREKMEENVFRNHLDFFAAAKISSSFPPPTLPEIAFAGRSNVGKSSLLNALTRQWGVVRTSDKPGLTQTINFFKLASKLCLVDLPGYGFAYAKEEVKESWEELVKEFVSTRVGLQRVCLLIDTKWGMKARDFELIELMERSKTPYQIVLTKTDMVFPIDVARRAMQIQENLKKRKSIVDPVVMVSSKSGAGIRNLRSVLAKIARFVKP